MKRNHIFLILGLVVLSVILVGTWLQGRKPTTADRAAADTKTVTEKIREKAIDSTRTLPADDIHRRAWADDDVRRLASDTGAGHRR